MTNQILYHLNILQTSFLKDPPLPKKKQLCNQAPKNICQIVLYHRTISLAPWCSVN